MNKIFRRLPLPAKLLMILLIPLALLIYISIELYQEKSDKVKLIEGYIDGIEQSGSIIKLIDELQNERRFSFDFAMKKDFRSDLVLQRPKTDSAIRYLELSKGGSLAGFTKYTFLEKLQAIRASIDTANLTPNEVMHYYTTVIFRINLLNPAPIATDIYLEPVHRDMIGQKLLSEMVTYLGILRSNIYNVLYTRKYMIETLIGLRGVHEVYDTYEIEFMQKASPAAIIAYKRIANSTALKPTTDYIGKLFSTFKFDSTYDAGAWWQISANGIAELKRLQTSIWRNVEDRVMAIYKTEKRNKTQTFIYLIIGLLGVLTIVAYVIRVITITLREVKVAAEKISLGETGFKIKVISNDVIGDLSRSVKRIDENNKTLADAADAIGRGDFRVTVRPRSSQDILGNALVKMKEDLEKFANEKDTLLLKKDEFMSIASHELKTPITSVKAALQIVERLTSSDENMLAVRGFVETANKQVNKLTNIVNDLLDITKIQSGKLELTKSQFRIKELLDDSIEQLQFNLMGHKITKEGDLGQHVQVYADRHRMEQVMINLLSNAVKYSPNATDIIVRVKQEDGFIKVSIQDFGIGISPDKIPMIFDRFFRVEQSSQNFSGLGLGLYISAEIVRRHKGEIGVDSVIDKGSTFWFTLPT